MLTYSLRINGSRRQIEGESGDSLLSVLRYDLDLTGSKFGCGEGHCGACTVLVNDDAVRSCVTRLGGVEGASIVTIEGLAPNGGLHAVQEAFLEAEAFQCGYCTPGMIMAAVGLLRAHPSPSEEDIAKAMDRNVCRCGAYPRIVQAIQIAAERLKRTSANAQEVRR